jgi:DNA-binding NarL/FixJ family response regulator
MKAVVVDDSRIVRERVTDMLRELPLIDEIEQAVDGLDALEVIARVKPDLVVLDIQMPSADGKRVDNGMDVLKAIKTAPHAPAVIMLSNFAEPQYRARCNQLGADAFLDKSNEFFQLIDIAEALLNQRRVAQL